MDRIILLIVLYFIVKKIYRFLTNETDGQTKKQRPRHTYPIPANQHMPHPDAKSTAKPSSVAEVEPKGAEHPKILTDIMQVLKDLEGEQKLQNTGKTLEVPSHKTGEFRKHSDIGAEKTHTPVEGEDFDYAIQEGKKVALKPQESLNAIISKEKEGLYFDELIAVRQGIIMSEILRPPLVIRNTFAPPYIRG